MSEAEEKLVAEMKSGKVEAFEEIVRRYGTRIYNLAYCLTGDKMDSQDITQDVFLTIYNKINTFEGKSALSTWIYRIVLNVSYMKLRGRKRERYISIDDSIPQYREDGGHLHPIKDWSKERDKVLLSNETKEVIWKAINKLQEKERIVFILRDVQGLSNEEVSEILGISIPAVKTRLHHSRLFLRKKLSNYFDEFK